MTGSPGQALFGIGGLIRPAGAALLDGAADGAMNLIEITMAMLVFSWRPTPRCTVELQRPLEPGQR